MKTLFTIFFLIAGMAVCQAQTNKTDSCFSELDSLTGKKVYIMAGKMPVIESGENFHKELIKRIKPKKGSVDSRIIVAFVIDEQGKLSGKRIIRGKEMARQILTLLDDFKWKPDTCNGVNVAALYLLPITIDFEE